MKRGLTMSVLLGACLCASNAEAKPYKGAEVYTQTTYSFGRMEVRMRVARGPGILSTFFSYKPGSEGAGALWEEIDIEVFGKSNANAWQSNILVGNPRMGSEQVHNAPSSLADGYHTYTIEWTPSSVVWQLDGVEARRTNGGQADQLKSAHTFHFNLWASDVSSWAGAFDSSVLPQSQYVNWIRYYRYENSAFVLDWTDDFNTFDTARWSKADWTFDGNLVDFVPGNAAVRDGTLVLCMSAEGQAACPGAVPADSAGNGGGQSGGGAGGTGGAPSGGTSGAATAGGASASGGSGTNGGTAMIGSAGTGGSVATGGGFATGGSVATGGSAATAGATQQLAGASSGGLQSTPSAQGTGGNSASNAGTAANGNGAQATPQPAGQSGCGCTVAANRGLSWLWVAGALLLRTRLLRKRQPTPLGGR